MKKYIKPQCKQHKIELHTMIATSNSPALKSTDEGADPNAEILGKEEHESFW